MLHTSSINSAGIDFPSMSISFLPKSTVRCSVTGLTNPPWTLSAFVQAASLHSLLSIRQRCQCHGLTANLLDHNEQATSRIKGVAGITIVDNKKFL
jgi:hypothetical protein